MTSTVTRVRDFASADYEAWVAGGNRCYPDYPWTVKDPNAVRTAYELVDVLRRDVPAIDPATDERSAFFVAIDRDGQWVGMSNLERQLEDPTFVWQGLTGVRREARGRGIAIALKLRTVSYAQRMGVDHIKTWNDQKNRADARHQRGHGLSLIHI